MNETASKSVERKRHLPKIFAAAVLLGIVLLAPYVVDAMVLEVQEQLTIEAGEHFPWPDEFLAERERGEADMFFTSDVSHIDTSVPGTYPVELKSGGGSYLSEVRVVDTVAPTGTAQDLTVIYTELPQASDFITDIQDVTDVTVSFQTEPDFDLEGEQTVSLLLTDAGGNIAQLSAQLTIIFDLEPPVITGVDDILVYQGDTIAYRNGITVTDNRDTAPQLTIDSSTVDLSTPGQYTVTYTATDYSGNATTLTASVSVREKQPDFVELDVIYAAVDEILAGIITEGMTDREKVEASAKWIRGHCGFVGTSLKDDWLQAAYRMMDNRYGDCYNYFALMKLMLERMDIPNIDVEKIPNHEKDSHHYWSLVSVDGGANYYHVDMTPRADPANFLLVTDEFMDNYSRSHKNCFNRDTTLYPPTPKEPLP